LAIGDNCTNQSCSYGHDDLSRIAGVNCGASIWEQNFSYDPFGNMTKTVPGGATGQSFSNSYNLAANQVNATGLSYDPDGNLKQDLWHSYTWDGNWGNPLSIDTVSLKYDGLGRMVEQCVGPTGSCAYKQSIVYAPSGAKLALMNGQTFSSASGCQKDMYSSRRPMTYEYAFQF
jgi:hypothetical protein